MKIYYIIILSLIFITIFLILNKKEHCTKEHFATIDYNLDYITSIPVLNDLYDRCINDNLSSNFCTVQISSYLDDLLINSLKSKDFIDLSELPFVQNINDYKNKFKKEAKKCVKINSKIKCKNKIKKEINKIQNKNKDWRNELNNYMSNYITLLKK